MEVIDAGEGHTEALNPSNPRFRAAMAGRWTLRRAGATERQTLGTVAADAATMHESSAG